MIPRLRGEGGGEGERDGDRQGDTRREEKGGHPTQPPEDRLALGGSDCVSDCSSNSRDPAILTVISSADDQTVLSLRAPVLSGQKRRLALWRGRTGSSVPNTLRPPQPLVLHPDSTNLPSICGFWYRGGPGTNTLQILGMTVYDFAYATLTLGNDISSW